MTLNGTVSRTAHQLIIWGSLNWGVKNDTKFQSVQINMACHYSLDILDSPSKEGRHGAEILIFSERTEIMRITLNIYPTLCSWLEYGFCSHSNPAIPGDFHLLAQFIFHLALSNKEKQCGISIVVPNSMGKWMWI